MNETTVLQQELNFRLSLLRLVTNAPFQSSAEKPSTQASPESSQIENMYSLVTSGSTR